MVGWGSTNEVTVRGPLTVADVVADVVAALEVADKDVETLSVATVEVAVLLLLVASRELPPLPFGSV